MKSDYIQLSWNSDTGETMPAGSYIEYNGEIYRLLEPYFPSMENEAKYIYSPKFQSRIMVWNKQITPIYTYEQDGSTVKSREMDWAFTGSPADAMYIVKQAIKNETGEEWTVQLSDSLPATITISSQSSSIFSVLNSIASECDTEWWGDKKTNTLFLSKCIYGEPIKLEVGDNVQVPSVTSGSDGYYTRFYAFGSTRNIVQGTSHNVAVVNNRLTLNPTKYPGGYKDVRDGLKPEEIFVKTLYFDSIYPSSKLTISDVRARLRYRLDNSGNKIKIGGTDEEPIYEQYAIWYFQISGFDFDSGTIIEGLNLSASFESGQLSGRDFELIYHEKAETVSDANDVTPFDVKAGDYKIVIDETSGQIIPGVAYIIPQEGDSVILYNIEMPAEYTASAQVELEAELDKEIASYSEDNNTYQMESDPTRFYTQGTNIQMGQAVTFVNGEKSLSTRVQMVEKRLDYPCYQTIKVGNRIIKGNTQQLKEDVASVNQNIDVIKSFNELSASLSQAYANAQREMIEGFARISNMWKFDPDNEDTIYTTYNAYSTKEISAGGFSDEEGGETGGETGGGAGIDENKLWEILCKEGTQQISKSHLTTALTGYATEQWVLEKNYATTSDLDSRIDALVNGAPAAFDTLKEIADVLQGNVDSIGDILTTLETKADKTITISAGTGLTGGGNLSSNRTLSLATVGTAGTYTKVVVDAYGRVTGHSALAESDIPALSISKITGLQTALDGKLDKTTFNDLFEKVEVSSGKYAIKAKYDLYTEGELSAGGYSQEGSGSGVGNIFGIKVNGQTYKPEEGYITIPNYPTELSWGKITGKPSTLAGYGIQASDLLSTLKTVDGNGSGLDADTIDGTQKSELFTSLSSSSSTNLSITIGGTTKSISDLYATSAEKLGSTSVGSSVTPIYFSNGKPISCLYSFGNSNGNAAINNGTLCTNLNSDLLDGVDGYKFFQCGEYAGASSWSSYMYNKAYYTTGSIPSDGPSGSYGYGTLLVFDSGGSTGNGGAITQIYFPHATSYAPQYRTTYQRDGSRFHSWKSLARTTDNVASATKLQNERTIWGQSFDGTDNVTGSLTGVGDITSTGFFLKGYNSENPYLKLSNSKASSAFVQLSSGGILSMDFGLSSGKNISIDYNSGNIGIGTSSPSYKCHVAGTLYASGATTLGSTLSVSSTSTFTGRTTHKGGVRIQSYIASGTTISLSTHPTFKLTADSSYGLYGWITGSGDAHLQAGSENNSGFFDIIFNELGGNIGMGTKSPSEKLHVIGNILATGEISAGSSSDARLKTIFGRQDYIKRLMDIGMVVDYEYNELAFTRNVRSIERRRYTGLIYQDVKKVLPQMAGEDADGYGYLNYIHTDYINLIAGALQQTIQKQETIEQRVERLEKENTELKNKIAALAA